MPLIGILEPWGMYYQISTRRRETLQAWFDEILPHANASLGERDVPPAQIRVQPMWWAADASDVDWLTDGRVLGRQHPFPAKGGVEGLTMLDALRDELTRELAEIKNERGKMT